MALPRFFRHVFSTFGKPVAVREPSVGQRRALRQSLSALRRWMLQNHTAIRRPGSDAHDEYMSRARGLHAEVSKMAGLPELNAGFSPLTTDGRAGFYYGELEAGNSLGAEGEPSFIKVGPSSERQHAVMAALARGDIPGRGKHYCCLAPTHVLCLEGVADIYTFPLWRRLPSAVKGSYANPVVAKGLAEFNLSFCKQGKPLPVDLWVKPLSLGPLTAERFEIFSLPDRAVESYLARHEEIRQLWREQQTRLDSLPLGLLHGDMAISNHGEHEGRLFLLDLENAYVGPLGGDLDWMLYYAERIESPRERQRHIEQIVKQYVTACHEQGAEVNEQQVFLAAQAIYFMKWLFPGGGTQSNLQALEQRQLAALRSLVRANLFSW